MLSLPPSFWDHLADRLELAVYDTIQEWREAVKIKINEPVFFEGQNRQVGEILDVERGPYRKVAPASYPSQYGYDLVPQFEELATEIKASPVTDTPPPIPPTPAAVTKPASVSKISLLAQRVARFHDTAIKEADATNTLLDTGEPMMAQAFTNAQSSIKGVQQDIQSVLDVLKDLPGSNGPL
jgi:hypothetical protein